MNTKHAEPFTEVNKKDLSRELHEATRRRHSWEPPQTQPEEGVQQRGESHRPTTHRGSDGAPWGSGGAQLELYEAPLSEPHLSAGEREMLLERREVEKIQLLHCSTAHCARCDELGKGAGR